MEILKCVGLREVADYIQSLGFSSMRMAIAPESKQMNTPYTYLYEDRETISARTRLDIFER